MNIFVVHENPEIAARSLCDKHVVKMILESVQMLSFATPEHLGAKSHYMHPCSIWARQTVGNFEWLQRHAIELLFEYTRRYNKTHKWHDKVPLLQDAEVLDGPRTDFVQAMPDEYRRPNAVDAYRAYYIGDKARFAKWKHGNEPDWWPAKAAA